MGWPIQSEEQNQNRMKTSGWEAHTNACHAAPETKRETKKQSILKNNGPKLPKFDEKR